MPKWDRPLKNIRMKLAEERRIAALVRLAENGDSPATIPEKGTPAYAAEELRDVMKLPAAETAVFKMASADVLAETILEDMSQSEDKELRMHAQDVSTKLIVSVVKAQKKMTAPITINTQINTGGVPVAGLGTPKQGQRRLLRAPSSPPAAPSGGNGQPSSDTSSASG